MGEECPFSRQIEVFCETNGKKDPPHFLTEHFETCEKCRPLFLKLGNELEKIENLIPMVKKESIGIEEENILRKFKQFSLKKKKHLLFF